MFTSRTITTELVELLNNDETRSLIRLIVATYLLKEMLTTGGLKGDKVRAAFEYADMLLNDTEITREEKE